MSHLKMVLDSGAGVISGAQMSHLEQSVSDVTSDTTDITSDTFCSRCDIWNHRMSHLQPQISHLPNGKNDMSHGVVNH